ncbi:MAG TPA: beta-L-arabinofuranosidase domain-containing protein, partial [Bacillota bacterium]|nr:beta-L-arabinofuranosidase domain-containing protein [Bacillota bacterium]
MRQQLDLKPKFQSVTQPAVQITGEFWRSRIDGNRTVSLPYQYEQLITSGVLDNFKRVLGQKDGRACAQGTYAGPFWMDSDAYKWLEAASYSLATHPDSQLEEGVEETIALIAAAQEPNGYLNTYFQLVEPDKKFTNLGMCHELYCAGHLIQAAVAHYRGTSR